MIETVFQNFNFYGKTDDDDASHLNFCFFAACEVRAVWSLVNNNNKQ